MLVLKVLCFHTNHNLKRFKVGIRAPPTYRLTDINRYIRIGVLIAQRGPMWNLQILNIIYFTSKYLCLQRPENPVSVGLQFFFALWRQQNSSKQFWCICQPSPGKLFRDSGQVCLVDVPWPGYIWTTSWSLMATDSNGDALMTLYLNWTSQRLQHWPLCGVEPNDWLIMTWLLTV